MLGLGIRNTAFEQSFNGTLVSVTKEVCNPTNFYLGNLSWTYLQYRRRNASTEFVILVRR